MKALRRQGGFTLIELLVVILILAILMAIALPLYLRAVANSEKQTCRSNMQTIANAEQAYKVRSTSHVYTADPADLTTPDPTTNLADLAAVPQCPKHGTVAATYDYTVDLDVPSSGLITIKCTQDAWHNEVNGVADHGFVPGMDSQ